MTTPVGGRRHRCPCRRLRSAHLLSYLETINESGVVFCLFFLSSPSSSSSSPPPLCIIYSIVSRPRFSEHTTLMVGCIAAKALAFRPRKAGPVTSHVKPNRTSKRGFRLSSSLIISTSSKAAIRARRSKVKLPSPSWVLQGTQDFSPIASHRSLTISPHPWSNNGIFIHVKIRQHGTIRGASRQAHANDTHTVGLLQHTRMKENIQTPARAHQLGVER